MLPPYCGSTRTIRTHARRAAPAELAEAAPTEDAEAPDPAAGSCADCAPSGNVPKSGPVVRAGLSARGQIAQLNRTEGSLARHEDQLAPLFQMHVGGAVDQVVGQAVGDRRHRAQAARTDDHSGREKRSAGDAGGEIAVAMIDEAAGTGGVTVEQGRRRIRGARNG